ncbi:DUF6611 family protein [Microbacterium marinilacus]|nr:DUF6611 family protein [Microbacterium marinilacus]
MDQPRAARSTSRTPSARWGYVSRSVGRYGAVSVRLVVYPPDSDPRDLLSADLFRFFVPCAVVLGLTGALALCAAGVPVGSAAAIVLAVLVPVGVFMGFRAAPVNRRAVSLWSCRSAFHVDRAALAAEQRAESLAHVLQSAAEDYRQGRSPHAVLQSEWQAAFDDITSGQARRG